MPNPNKVLLAGAVFYFFLSPFFFHPDIKIIYHHSQFLSRGVFNIYSYLDSHKTDSTLGQFVYPPLAYFFFGLIYPLLSFLAGPGFSSWLGTGNNLISSQPVFRYLFLMKFPLILVHLLTGYLLSRHFNERLSPSFTLLLWLFNPVSVYVVALMGQFDILPVLLTVISLILLESTPFVALLALGFAAGFKTYPLLLVPLAAVTARSWPKRLFLMIVGLLPYVLFSLPFLRSPAFISSSFSSGLTQRFFDLSFSLGPDKQIYLLLAALMILFFHLRLHSDRFTPFLVAPLLILAGSHFHPQWALWALPFVIVFLVKTRDWAAGTCLLFGWLAITWTFSDLYLTWGLLSPLDPQAVLAPSLISHLPPLISWPSLAQTIFAGVAGWVIYHQLQSA